MAEYSGMGADRERDRATARQVASRGVYRTERLRLLPIDARHALELWELHQDKGIARWYPLSREQALRFAERMESSWTRGVGKWLAYEKSTGALVGRGGPSWAVVEGTERAEIGWAFRRAVWGRALKERSTTLARIAYRSVVGVEAYFQTWLSSFARRIRTRVSL
jgi:RimJ/RimL family protein N-acetyltransferase